MEEYTSADNLILILPFSQEGGGGGGGRREISVYRLAATVSRLTYVTASRHDLCSSVLQA